MSDKTMELIKSLQENPDRKLIFMYPDECSDHSYTLGYPSKIVVDEYWTDDDRVWLKFEDEDELLQQYSDIFFDDLFSDLKEWGDEQEKIADDEAKKFLDAQSWKECICVYISH